MDEKNKNIIHPEWHDYFKRQWEPLLAGKMPPSYEYPVISRTGEVKWLYQKNVLICDNRGKPTAIEGIISDITERRKIEEALRRTIISQCIICLSPSLCQVFEFQIE